MDSMNKICENERVLARQRSRDSSSIHQQSELSSPKPTKIDAFSTVSTDTESQPHHATSTSSLATTSADIVLNLTTSDHADTNFYTVNDGTRVVADSFNVTFADQFTFRSATESAGKNE